MLAEYIKLLESAAKSESHELLFPAMFNALKGYSETQFSIEEQLMDLYGYPQVRLHLASHKMFEIKMHQMGCDYESGVIGPSSIISFLKAWLVSHIEISDIELATYVNRCVEQKLARLVI